MNVLYTKSCAFSNINVHIYTHILINSKYTLYIYCYNITQILMQLKWMHIQMAWCVRMFNSFWQASTTFKIMHFECVVTVLCRASHAYDQKKTILTEPASAWWCSTLSSLYISMYGMCFTRANDKIPERMFHFRFNIHLYFSAHILVYYTIYTCSYSENMVIKKKIM